MEIHPYNTQQNLFRGKTLVLTTTNGTRLLHMALAEGAQGIITGSFCNLSAVCDYLIAQNKNIILACAAWKDRINIEDTLFAGAVVSRMKNKFHQYCDATQIAETFTTRQKMIFSVL